MSNKAYTTTPYVRKLKEEIKTCLVIAKRIDKMAVPYDDAILKAEDGESIRMPFEYRVMKQTSDYLYNRIYELGKEVQKERRFMSEINPRKNRRNQTKNDIITGKFIETLTNRMNFKGYNYFDEKLNLHIVHRGYQSINIKEIDKEPSTGRQIVGEYRKEIFNKFMEKVKATNNIEFYEYLKLNSTGFEIDEDTDELFIMFKYSSREYDHLYKVTFNL